MSLWRFIKFLWRRVWPRRSHTPRKPKQPKTPMFDSLRKMLPTSVTDVMDKGRNLIIQTYLNARYKPLGQGAGPVKDLAINRSKRCMDLTLELNGEAGPVQLKIRRYEVQERDGKKFLEVDGLETNRSWMDALFAIQSTGGKLLLRWELPTEVVLALA